VASHNGACRLLRLGQSYGVMHGPTWHAGKLHAAQQGMLQAAAKATQDALLQEQKCGLSACPALQIVSP
jgi:hypothetical protein